MKIVTSTTRPMLRLLMIVSTLAVCACTTRWEKPDFTAQEWERDKYECTLQGRQAAAGVGASGIIVQETEAATTRNRCLEVRGYARAR